MAVGFDPFRLESSTVLMMGVVNDCLEAIKYNHDHRFGAMPSHLPWIANPGPNY